MWGKRIFWPCFAEQDIITGDEIISDSYDLKEVDGVVYEVDCAMITLGAVEVSAYTHTPRLEAPIQNTYWWDVDTGANASAEEADEGVEDGAQQVNNVVNSFRLNSTSFDKKSYLSHLKSTCICLG